MSKKIALTPELLKSQGEEMTALSNEYESLFSRVSSTLTDTNSNWSSFLSNSFSSKILSAQKSFSGIVSMLSDGGKAAISSASAFDSIDGSLSHSIGEIVSLNNSATAVKAASTGAILGAIAASTVSQAQEDLLYNWSSAEPIVSLPKEQGEEIKIPEWSLQKYDNPEVFNYLDRNGQMHLGGGSVATYNYPLNGVQAVSCTYYTLKKLREKGLGYPFQLNDTNGGNWNGSQWYINSTGIPKAEGSGSIQQLLDIYGKDNNSVENIVVSFDGNHVLLLDKVYVDDYGTTKVIYSDNTNWVEGGVLTNPNESTPQLEESVAEFINRYTVKYRGYFGNIIGSTYIG